MTNQVRLEYGTIRILDDSVLEAYKESIKQYNKRARVSLGKFNSAYRTLTGSSPLTIIHLLNSGLLLKGTRLATREDLENAIKKDNNFLIGNYANFALALRTAGDSYKPNNLLAKRLAKQLKQRNMTLGNGKLMPLGALSLIEDEASHYGLVIDLKEDTEKSIRNLRDFNWDYIREDGLSCAVLGSSSGGFRCWLAGAERLAYSWGGGRVVVVSA